MTGLECLIEELKHQGISQQQREGKLPALVLSILAENPDIMTEHNHKKELEEIESRLYYRTKELTELKAKIAALNDCKQTLEDDIRREREKGLEKLEEKRKKMFDEIAELLKPIDAFNECLKEGETAEGRDSLKKAQLFIQNTTIKTNENNTAYIHGLGEILAGNKMPDKVELIPRETLEKIAFGVSNISDSLLGIHRLMP